MLQDQSKNIKLAGIATAVGLVGVGIGYLLWGPSKKRQRKLSKEEKGEFIHDSETGEPQPITRNFHVLFIRHAESYNNVIADEAEAKYKSSPYIEGSPARLDYHTRRVKDPPLSAKGEKEAQQLLDNSHLKHIYFEKLALNGRVKLCASPMKRAIQTALSLGSHLGLGVELHREVHEMGGIFYYDIKKNDIVADGGPTPREIQEEFPTANVDYLLEGDMKLLDKGWWHKEAAKFKTKEPEESLTERVQKTVAWLRDLTIQHRDQFLQAKAAGQRPQLVDHVVIVTHADFLNEILIHLLKLKPNLKYAFYHRNTGVTHLQLSVPHPSDKDAFDENNLLRDDRNRDLNCQVRSINSG